MLCIRKCALLVIAFVAVVVSVSVASAELLVRRLRPQVGVDPRYDRFANSSDFIGAGLDFSGVGQDSSPAHWATMISPHFFLERRTFSSQRADRHVLRHQLADRRHPSASVLAGTKINLRRPVLPTDVFSAFSSTPVSEAYYPLLDPNSLSAGQSIFVYGKPNRVGTNVISETGSYDLYSAGPAPHEVV